MDLRNRRQEARPGATFRKERDIPSIFDRLRRFSMLKGAGGLPISCLSGAPTPGYVGPTKARASNSQVNGGKEDKLKSATDRKKRQDTANDICFGC